jgi:hypothetical protein
MASAVRDRGNLPRARALLHEGLTAAQESGDDSALGSVHDTLMTVEMLSGRLPHAAAHGWRAVNLLQEEERYNALVSLAGCFFGMDELEAAEDSYAIVLQRGVRPDNRCIALEMFAHIAAVRGDRRQFEERVECHDLSEWRGLTNPRIYAHTLQYRGLSWRALGDLTAARAWLERARDYAQEHGVNQVFFDCETSLAELESTGATPAHASFDAAEAAPGDPGPAPAELAAIRIGVGALRRELAPV